jgi:hypothetical protein
MMWVPLLVSEAENDPAGKGLCRSKPGQADAEFEEKVHCDPPVLPSG